MYRNTTKPKINTGELAYVTAKFPATLRKRLPLPVLEVHLYKLAIDNESLIEEVEAVFDYEVASRRSAPEMRVSYSAHA